MKALGKKFIVAALAFFLCIASFLEIQNIRAEITMIPKEEAEKEIGKSLTQKEYEELCEWSRQDAEKFSCTGRTMEEGER